MPIPEETLVHAAVDAALDSLIAADHHLLYADCSERSDNRNVGERGDHRHRPIHRGTTTRHAKAQHAVTQHTPRDRDWQ